MIAGLMNNRSVETVDRTPGAADVPILGTLFRSNNFRRGDTELVIVVTPYLVRPVNADQIVLPTDGFRNATTGQRLLMNGIADGQNEPRPTPRLETPEGQQPGDASQPPQRPAMMPPAPARQSNNNRRGNRDRQEPASPGFSLNQ
jgi:pilus assembly protein CpaC